MTLFSVNGLLSSCSDVKNKEADSGKRIQIFISSNKSQRLHHPKQENQNLALEWFALAPDEWSAMVATITKNNITLITEVFYHPAGRALISN